MSMPKRLVFVRHGQSEANVVHKAERNGEYHPAHDAIYARHDWEHRLSEKGIEQAKTAGKWITKHIMPVDIFDRRYVSTYQRAIETALHIAGEVDVQWYVDDRFRERDWGEFGATPYEERKLKFPYTINAQKSNSFYAGLNGGESLSDVQMRVRDTYGTFHRDVPNGNVLVVSHGELITMNRYLIERLLPEEIIEIENDKSQEIKNCTIVDYSRVNPMDDQDVSEYISWMRMIYPYEEENSPFGGSWQKLQEKRLLSSSDLVQRLRKSPPLTYTPIKEINQ